MNLETLLEERERFQNRINSLDIQIEIAKANEKECIYIDSGILGISDGLYKPQCISDTWDEYFLGSQLNHFKYCPYCGKKIKVIEAETKEDLMKEIGDFYGI